MKGFAFPRRFKSAASLLPTLTRNNRELTNFLNSFVVRLDGDKSTLTLPGNLTVVGDISTDSWTAPTLLNSWVNFGATERVAGFLKTSDGTVHIRGLVKDGTSASAIIFALPSAYRPSRVIILPARAQGGLDAELRIASNGEVWMSTDGSTTWSSIEAVFQLD